MSFDDVSDRDFADFSRMFYLRSGIKLKPDKKYLVIHRLQRLLTDKDKIGSFSDLSKVLKEGRDQVLITRFVDALTTNYSYFFRDPVHFRFLQYCFKNKLRSKAKIRIWSAACSSGEEPYSIALIASEYFPELLAGDFRIEASDISQSMLDRAEAGIYRRDSLEKNMGERTILKYFSMTDDPRFLRLNPGIKSHVTFRKVNLLERFPFRDEFDIIFLRNVLIYFGSDKKEMILSNLAPYLGKDGYLIISLSESLLGVNHPFKHIRHSIYTL